jgi:MoxR-like ATPase
MAALATVDKEAIHAELRKRYPAGIITRKQIIEYKNETGVYPVWIRRDKSLKVERGKYRIPGSDYVPPTVESADEDDDVAAAETPKSSPKLVTSSDSDSPVVLDASLLKSLDARSRLDLIRKQASVLSVVPAKDPCFVEYGDYSLVKRAIESGEFFPVMIHGLSGCGKTMQVEQACAQLGREYIRVNITRETDEDDLLGGFRLVDGNTVFEVGPAVVAMIRGAVLLLDEADLGDAKLLCLQPIMEGRAVTLKKLGIIVEPTAGFTVFATMNTKGRGDETGSFVGTNLMNEAFLERFPVTIEQQYPDIKTEKTILTKAFRVRGNTPTKHSKVFFDTLAKWAEAIRKSYGDQTVDYVLSTRRLVHIVKAYGIFAKGSTDLRLQAQAGEDALAYCTNRFDTRTKEAFLDLFNKLVPDDSALSNIGNLDGDDVSDPKF